MSALASSFREIWWSSLLTVVDKSIRRRTKVRPDEITLAAKDNLPIKDKNSLLMHFLRLSQKARLDSNSDSLSVGSFTHISKVTIDIPRNTRAVVGPANDLFKSQ